MPWEDRYVHHAAEDLLEAYLPHVRKLFPAFSREWVQRCWSWTEQYAQPVITKRYSELKPPFRTPIRDLWLCSMAQVYPEDRGMNYAVLYSRRAVAEMLADM
jgi:hypothetical protein